MNSKLPPGKKKKKVEFYKIPQATVGRMKIKQSYFKVKIVQKYSYSV